MPAATPAAELGAGDGDDLDALLAELGVGVGVAFVGDDDARLEGEQVVAVVPLLALGLELVATGGDHTELADPEVLGDRVDEAGALLAR